MVLQSSPVMPSAMQDWRYELRREAQQLLPHLYLGPLSAAKNTEWIQTNQITLLLAVRSNMTARVRRMVSQIPGVKYESIDVAGNHELISQFQRAQEIIDAHYVAGLPAESQSQLSVPLDGRALRTFQEQWLQTHGAMPPGGRTLLFCESGNERSAAVAAAYIMQHLGGTTVQAIQMVQARRFCVCFDDAIKWMLTSYEPIWKARRMYGDAQNGATAVAASRTAKRRMDDDDDDDDDEWNGGGRAPFLDQPEEDVEMA
jgi:serine/threonine/tyrosine-interacting protein